MDRDRDEQRCENDLDQLVKQAFGIDDDQLLRDFLLAQTEIKDSQIPPEPENGFERLLGKVEERGIEPRYNSEDMHRSEHREKVKRKYRRVRPLLRVAVAVGALLVLLVAMGMTAGAKRSYKYYVTERDSSKNDLVLENVTSYSSEELLEAAYRQISDLLDLRVLQLGYVPEDLVYVKTAINGKRATMYFEYKNNMFYIIQQVDETGSLINTVSDRKVDEKVFNEWLNREISIEKAITENNEVEMSIDIVCDDAYYQLCGIMDEKEFRKVVEALHFGNIN